MKPFDLLDDHVPLGLSVIEASAGTGKTWTIAHLIPKLLIDGRLAGLKQAVLVTFTEDAARELAERVRRSVIEAEELLAGKRQPLEGRKGNGLRLLQKAYDALDAQLQKQARLRLKTAAEESGELSVSTIHAFCKQVLQREAFLCGMAPGFELLTDASELQESVLRDLWRGRLSDDPLLSAVAAAQGWTLEQDRQAWRLLEDLPGRPLHPEPLELDAAKASFLAALQALKRSAGDLLVVAKAFKDGLSTNKAARPQDLGRLQALLAGLDPAQPRAEHLAELDGFTKLHKWFADRGAGKPVVLALKQGPLAQAAEAAQAAVDALHWAWTGELARTLDARMQARLGREHASTFNDLITRLHGALHGPNGDELALRLRKKWSLCLVDESQDTDPLQLAIFEKIFNRSEAGAELTTRLVLIGDPKQAIYGFRGADLQAYLGAAERAGDARRSLLTTQRSSQALVAGLNALWTRLPKPMGQGVEVQAALSALTTDELLPPNDSLPALVLALAGGQDYERWDRGYKRQKNAAAACAAALRAVLGQTLDTASTVQPGDCCVLVRSNYEAKAVAKALRGLRIPVVLRDDADVLLSDEAVDLRCLLHASLKPARRALRRAALASGLLGLDAAALQAMGDDADEAWRLRLAGLGEAWSKRGLAGALALLEQGWPAAPGLPAHAGVLQQLAPRPDAERRLTDWRHVAELLQGLEAQGRRQPEALLHAFDAAQASAGERTASEERLRRLEADGSAVQVLTMHRAKGLEFELVFCPYLWSVPKPKDKQRRVLRIGAKRALCEPKQLDEAARGTLAKAEAWQALQEHLRLAYVALTRAKRRAWVLMGLPGCSDHHASVLPPSALDWLLRPADAPDGETWCAAEAAAKKLEDPALRVQSLQQVVRDLQALAPDQIALVEATLDAEPWTPTAPSSAHYAPNDCGRAALPTWQLASYSSLIRGHEAPARERRDPSAEPGDGAPSAPLPLSSFPAGAHIGNCLHELLEGWDFQDAAQAPVAQALRKHGLDGPLKDGQDPAALLTSLLPQWAQAVVPVLDVPLAEAAKLKQLSEWAFLAGLGAPGLDAAALSGAFVRHARNPAELAYAHSVASLPPNTVHGYLHGFIDRLLLHQGRWAVLDWKSNQLGPSAEDYSPERLWAAACEHHYLLQLHLYLVALRRHLRARDPQAHLAGAGLCYLRGLEAGTHRGFLWVAPSDALLDELDALFMAVAR